MVKHVILWKLKEEIEDKAAVKAGREDTPETLAWIAEQVIVNPKVRFCPHGRPVAFEMTKSQFEKQFERL